MPSRAALLLALGLAACGADGLDIGFGVALDLRFAASVTDADLARVQTLRFTASGDETSVGAVDLARPARREERLVYRPLAGTRALTVAVSAEDGAGAQVAAGTTAALQLVAGQGARVDVTLERIDPTACTLAGALVCEDFEAGVPGAATGWSTAVEKGTVSVDTTRAHRGLQSLHIHHDAIDTNGVSDVRLVQSVHVPGQHLYARGWFYLPPMTKTAGFGVFDLFTVQSAGAPYNGVYMQAHVGDPTGGVPTTVTNFGTGYYADTGPSLVYDRWVCVEWQLDNVDGQAGATGLTKVWVGDPQVLAVDGSAGISTRATPPLDEIFVGNYFSSTAGGFPVIDYWVDDLIIDDKPIGCAK